MVELIFGFLNRTASGVIWSRILRTLFTVTVAFRQAGEEFKARNGFQPAVHAHAEPGNG